MQGCPTLIAPSRPTTTPGPGHTVALLPAPVVIPGGAITPPGSQGDCGSVSAKLLDRPASAADVDLADDLAVAHAVRQLKDGWGDRFGPRCRLLAELLALGTPSRM